MRLLERLLLGVVMVVVLAGCASSTVTSSDMTVVTQGGPSSTESTREPVTTTLGKTVAADGALASAYPALPLTFGGSVSGEVTEIAVQPGDRVAAGDLVARLDDTALQRAVAEAELALERAQVDKAQAEAQWERDVADAEASLVAARNTLTTTLLQYSSTSVEEARIALERARQAEQDAKHAYDTPVLGDWTPPEQREHEYEVWQQRIQDRELAEMRYDDALDSRSVNGMELKRQRQDVEMARRKLAALEEGIAPSYQRAIEDAARELEKAEEAVANARLVAPWAAIVRSVDIAPNAQVNASTPIITLLNIEDGLRFVTQNLSEQHVAALEVGQRAVITLRSYPDTPLEGTIEAIVPQGDGEQSATATDAHFTVRVNLAPVDLHLLPGLTGRVEIFTEE